MGSPALIPIGREQSGKQKLALGKGATFLILKPYAEGLRQVHDRDPARGRIDEDRLQQILELPYIARPVVAKQIFRDLLTKTFHRTPILAIQLPDVVVDQERDIFLAFS